MASRLGHLVARGRERTTTHELLVLFCKDKQSLPLTIELLIVDTSIAKLDNRVIDVGNSSLPECLTIWLSE